jgi:hypothetical protein
MELEIVISSTAQFQFLHPAETPEIPVFAKTCRLSPEKTGMEDGLKRSPRRKRIPPQGAMSLQHTLQAPENPLQFCISV